MEIIDLKREGDVSLGAKTFKRLSISLPAELDRAVLDLRKTEEYCRCSYVEIIRVLMSEGAKTLGVYRQDNGGKS